MHDPGLGQPAVTQSPFPGVVSGAAAEAGSNHVSPGSGPPVYGSHAPTSYSGQRVGAGGSGGALPAESRSYAPPMMQNIPYSKVLLQLVCDGFAIHTPRCTKSSSTVACRARERNLRRLLRLVNRSKLQCISLYLLRDDLRAVSKTTLYQRLQGSSLHHCRPNTLFALVDGRMCAELAYRKGVSGYCPLPDVSCLHAWGLTMSLAVANVGFVYICTPAWVLSLQFTNSQLL